MRDPDLLTLRESCAIQERTLFPDLLDLRLVLPLHLDGDRALRASTRPLAVCDLALIPQVPHSFELLRDQIKIVVPLHLRRRK